MKTEMRTICCVCHKTKSKNGWVEQTVISSKEISHGYCPACYSAVMDNLKEGLFKSRYEEKIGVGV